MLLQRPELQPMKQLLPSVDVSLMLSLTSLHELGLTASVALVRLKPSGYDRTALPGSPGRLNGGCTGFSDRLPVPQLPTQNDDTCDQSAYCLQTTQLGVLSAYFAHVDPNTVPRHVLVVREH